MLQYVDFKNYCTIDVFIIFNNFFVVYYGLDCNIIVYLCWYI